MFKAYKEEEFDFMEDPEDDRPRFELYVKKSSTNGGPRGSCPFSLKAFMFMNLTVDEKDFKAHPVDIINKPFYMMKLNPAGTVPILVDHADEDKVVTDSDDIVQYLNTVGKPKCDMCCDHNSEARGVISQVFPKLCQYLRNEDKSKDPEYRAALAAECQKVEDYLKVQSKKSKYLVSDQLTEPDCNFMPKLFQVICAGEYFLGFKVLDQYPQIRAYYERAKEEAVWKRTGPTYQDIVDGFLDHGVAKR